VNTTLPAKPLHLAQTLLIAGIGGLRPCALSGRLDGGRDGGGCGAGGGADVHADPAGAWLLHRARDHGRRHCHAGNRARHDDVAAKHRVDRNRDAGHHGGRVVLSHGGPRLDRTDRDVRCGSGGALAGGGDGGRPRRRPARNRGGADGTRHRHHHRGADCADPVRARWSGGLSSVGTGGDGRAMAGLAARWRGYCRGGRALSGRFFRRVLLRTDGGLGDPAWQRIHRAAPAGLVCPTSR